MKNIKIAITTTAIGIKTMSSLEIATLTGKRHSDVLRDILKILNEAEINERKFASVYIGGNNEERRCFLLPRRECDLVISGYSVKYRAAIIDRWHDLEAQVAATAMPTTMIEAGKLWIAEMEKTAALTKELSIAAPKVAVLERLTSADGSECISNAAKILGVAPQELFASLADLKWIFRRGSVWVAYQDKIKAELMTEKLLTVVKPDGADRIYAQARITAKGMAKLASYLVEDFLQ